MRQIKNYSTFQSFCFVFLHRFCINFLSSFFLFSTLSKNSKCEKSKRIYNPGIVVSIRWVEKINFIKVSDWCFASQSHILSKKNVQNFFSQHLKIKTHQSLSEIFKSITECSKIHFFKLKTKIYFAKLEKKIRKTY